MSAFFPMSQPSYCKQEKGQAFSSPEALLLMGNTMDISLDWLICNKSPMFYNDKMKKPEEKKIATDTLSADIDDLVQSMKNNPILRYEILSHFHRFKTENQPQTKKKTKT
jgi:hypothetical protein